MQRILISFLISLLLVGVFLTGFGVVSFIRTPEDTELLRAELASLEEQIQTANEKITGLEDALKRQRTASAPSPVAAAESGGITTKAAPVFAVQKNNGEEAVGAETGEDPAEAAPPDILRPYSNEMKNYVFDLIAQERTLQKKRAQELAEERRKKRQELSKGPYEKFNLKVNSMAEVLDFSFSQQELYYEISKDYHQQFNEARKGIDWKKREERDKYQETQKRLQEAFSEEVVNLLNGQQRELYDKLPEWKKRPHYLGEVTTGGTDAAVMSTTHVFENNGGQAVIRIK